MLELKVERRWKRSGYCIGVLYVNGVRFSETVEDEDRDLDSSMNLLDILRLKKPGITAIPKGKYTVVLSVSPKFKKKSWAKKYGGLVPEIVGVKGYSGVRIHPANKAEELEGCIAPGENKIKGGVINSVKKYTELFENYIFPCWTRKEPITIEIV